MSDPQAVLLIMLAAIILAVMTTQGDDAMPFPGPKYLRQAAQDAAAPVDETEEERLAREAEEERLRIQAEANQGSDQGSSYTRKGKKARKSLLDEAGDY